MRQTVAAQQVVGPELPPASFSSNGFGNYDGFV
jgi:hypothetical protein